MTKKVLLPFLTAFFMWFIMFSPWTAQYVNFWYSMSCAALILSVLTIWLSQDLKHQFQVNRRDIIIGIASAALLWIIFYIGDAISKWMFDFADMQVNNIYRIKDNENIFFIGIVLTFLIGPAEEFFWRGYLQHMLTKKHGKYVAYILTALMYALVHIWSFNFMLIMAAFICGLFWGLLYLYRHNMVTNILSHSLWDVIIFILLPINK